MLDYALGSRKPPEEVFGNDLAEKFVSISVSAEISGVPATIERRWNEPGSRSKVFLDGAEMLAPDFCTILNKRLGIPVLHYPQGDAYGKRPWPELSWRSLSRHIYRRQHFWADLAEMQPTSEQHACILQFLGLAEHVFSNEFGDLVKQQKQIFELQAAKDQFLTMLHEVSRDLLDEADRSVALTPESIASAMSTVREHINATRQQRTRILEELATSAENGTRDQDESSVTFFQQTSNELSRFREKAESVRSARLQLEQRAKDIELFGSHVTQEIDRLARARSAGATLADLKVTHCPACDRSLDPPHTEQSICYVCRHEVPSNTSPSDQRIDFELAQLKAEQAESMELLATLRADLEAHVVLERDLSGKQRRTEAMLQPIRRKAAAILPPELAALDVRTGQLDERLAQLQRIQITFAKREQLTAEIRRIEAAVAELETKVQEQSRAVNFEEAAEWLEDGINDYLNAINRRQPGAWPHDNRIKVSLRERQFRITIGGSKWDTKLGGTLTLYFLLAYNYGLLRLTSRAQCHYPGLVILDFPPELEETSIRDKENFVIEPFVDLVRRAGFEKTQVIAAGAVFENLQDANRIELNQVWTV